MKRLLILIILLGAVFRFTAVNWDSFGAFHPDERNISWAVTRIKFFNQMNPKFFAYGGLPIYLYRTLGEGVVAVTHDPVWLSDWGHIAVIGRCVSATLSTINILLIYLVGTAYFSPAVGLLSAALLAFSPWAIREAHFQTTETMLVFFLLAMTLGARRILVKLTVESIIQLGILWGLAMAAKTTSVLFGAIPAAALLLSKKNRLSKRFAAGLMLFAVAAGVFFIFSPYTILDFTHFRESMNYESGVALGRFTVPYTLQFLHTAPYLYHIQTMLWQAGPLVIVGLAGFIFLIGASLKKKHTEILVLLLFPLLYFSWTGSWFAKFNRYNVPFLPFVTIAAAWGCIALTKQYRRIGAMFTALILLTTIAWGLANYSLYFSGQTRIEATNWIYKHIPMTAKIYTEHWNDGLPLIVPTAMPYGRELLTVYDEDTDMKKAYYADKLSQGDYIILSTRRIWGTMPRLGKKYPLTKLFYEKLLDGSLGYREVATFSSYPHLLGFAVNDDTAEESIQVFDHPTVRIFQNTARLSRQQHLQLLTP